MLKVFKIFILFLDFLGIYLFYDLIFYSFGGILGVSLPL